MAKGSNLHHHDAMDQQQQQHPHGDAEAGAAAVGHDGEDSGDVNWAEFIERSSDMQRYLDDDDGLSSLHDPPELWPDNDFGDVYDDYFDPHHDDHHHLSSASYHSADASPDFDINVDLEDE